MNSEITNNLDIKDKMTDEQIEKLLHNEEEKEKNFKLKKQEEKNKLEEKEMEENIKNVKQVLKNFKTLDIKAMLEYIKNTKILFFIISNILLIIFYLIYITDTIEKRTERERLKEEKTKIEKQISNQKRILEFNIKELIDKTIYSISKKDIEEQLKRINMLNIGSVLEVKIKKVEENIKYSNVMDLELEVKKKKEFIFEEEVLTNLIYKKIKEGFLNKKGLKIFMSKKNNLINLRIVSIAKSSYEKINKKIRRDLSKIN